jgi:hypothetical protein
MFASFAAVSGGLIVGILGVLVALAGIGVGAFFGSKQLSRRRLSRSLQITQLVSVHSEARDRIHLSFEGEQINQVHLVKIRLWNSGNRSIQEADFERPLTIGFGGGTPLTVEVTDVHPPEMRPSAQLIEENGGGVQLVPLLLNPGDSLSLKILVRDFNGDLTYDYRIVGITDLIDADRQANRRRVLASPVVAIAAAVLGGLISAVAAEPLVDELIRGDSSGGSPKYAPICPSPAPGCASPLLDARGHGTAKTGNAFLIEDPWSREAVGLSMFLDPTQRKAQLSTALAGRFSTVSGRVRVVGCRQWDRATVELRDEAALLWSRSVEQGSLLRFHIKLHRVDFLVMAASAPPGLKCTMEVDWSGLQFG